MTDLEDLARRVEAAKPEQQREMLERAFDALNPIYWSDSEEPHPSKLAAFTAMLDAEAYESAAMTLVPEGWRWMAGHREHPRARAYVENGQPAFVGVGTRRNPERQWFEVTAATPALALTAAALRARAASIRKGQDDG